MNYASHNSLNSNENVLPKFKDHNYFEYRFIVIQNFIEMRK